MAEVNETSVQLRAALRRLAREGARYGAAKLDSWQHQVTGEAQPESSVDRAVVAGLHGLATGKENPAQAALKAVWAGADTAAARAALVGSLLLLPLTAPVLLLAIFALVAVVVLVLKALVKSGGIFDRVWRGLPVGIGA